jgi:hypothetical protein
MNCLMLATKLKQCNIMLHHFIASSLHRFKASGAQLCPLLFFTVAVLLLVTAILNVMRFY